MKISPFFIVYSLFLLIAQRVIFSDAVYVFMDQYPIMIFIFPLIILSLPREMEKPFLLVIAFVIGLILDVFNDTLGINAFAIVALAYFRSFVFRIVQPRQGYKPGENSFRSHGVIWMISFLILGLIIYAFTFFMIDAFTLVLIKKVLISAGLSALASLPFCFFLLLIKPR